MDDGKFRLRMFGKKTRTAREIKKDEVDINELIGINDYSMANEMFPDPFITCCFIDDTRIFINLFHNYSLTHYHFIWDYKKRRIVGKTVPGKVKHTAVSHVMCDCNNKNFPYKCFYNDEKN
jgi:hypothetical protein